MPRHPRDNLWGPWTGRCPQNPSARARPCPRAAPAVPTQPCAPGSRVPCCMRPRELSVDPSAEIPRKPGTSLGRLRGSAGRVLVAPECGQLAVNMQPAPDSPAWGRTFHKLLLHIPEEQNTPPSSRQEETADLSDPCTFCREGPGAGTHTDRDRQVSRAPCQAPGAQLSSSCPSLACPPPTSPDERTGAAEAEGEVARSAPFPQPRAPSRPWGTPPRLRSGVKLAGAGKPGQTAGDNSGQ